MLDHPAPKYNDGCVAIAGDAAHAAGPHLGAGAGFGIEDALVLATAIAHVDKKVHTGRVADAEKVDMCSKALSAYNGVRYDRTQWLVGATREACSYFQAHNFCWQDENGWSRNPFIPHGRDASILSNRGPSEDRVRCLGAYGFDDGGLRDDTFRGAGRAISAMEEGKTLESEISRLFHEIWDYDIDRMVKEVTAGLGAAESTEEVVHEPCLMGSI